MPKFLLKLTPALICWIIFIFVIFKIDYPKSLVEASLIQLTYFFLSFSLAAALTINLVIKNLKLSLLLALGVDLILILKGLSSLNIMTFVVVLIAVVLLVSYFKKDRA